MALPPSSSPPAIIADDSGYDGYVRMMPNGDLFMWWTSDELRKIRPDSNITIKPDDWRYKRLLKFFGGLNPGQSKPLPPQGPFTQEELDQGRSLTPDE